MKQSKNGVLIHSIKDWEEWIINTIKRDGAWAFRSYEWSARRQKALNNLKQRGQVVYSQEKHGYVLTQSA